MKVITCGLWTNRVISLYAASGGERIDVRDIGIRISNHMIVVEVQLIIVSLLLHIDNHYTQKLTLDLFIT